MTTSGMTMRSLLLVLTILFLSITPCHGFPGLLVERESGCMLNLSTEEVIMNNQVVAYKDSSHPDVKLVYKKGDEWVAGPIEIESLPATFTMKLETSLRDVQYAIETTEGAKFTSGAFGCDGRRASSRTYKDTGVELTVESLEKPINVWAGWATGHEAVQLTDNMVFVAKESKDEEEDAKKAALAKEQRKQVHEKQEGEKKETDTKDEESKSKPAKKIKKREGAKTTKTFEDGEEERHHFALPKSGIVKDEVHENQRAKKETRKRAHRLPLKEMVDRKKFVEQALPKKQKRQENRSPLHGYEKESYTPAFDMMQFLYGLVFFVGTMFAILLLLESGIGRKRKGHRDL